jgi:hypothetical protein
MMNFEREIFIFKIFDNVLEIINNFHKLSPVINNRQEISNNAFQNEEIQLICFFEQRNERFQIFQTFYQEIESWNKYFRGERLRAEQLMKKLSVRVRKREKKR